MKRRFRSSIFSDDILSTVYKEKEQVKPKVGFLSGKERDVLTGGHSRFECEHQREVRDVGPGSYNIEKFTSAFSQLGKPCSKMGYGGLASSAPRLAHRATMFRLVKTKSTVKYTLPKPKKKKIISNPHPPFGSAVPRKTGLFGKKEDTQSSYYDVERAYRRREMAYDHCFGGRAKLRPPVLWKCTPENTDICANCQEKPNGDYYTSGSDFLCMNCFDSEWNNPRKYSREYLYTFKTVRDCSDIHEHGGTTAAIPLVKNRDIRKQRFLESYFASFASPRKIVCEVKKVSKPKLMFNKGGDKLTVLFENKQKSIMPW